MKDSILVIARDRALQAYGQAVEAWNDRGKTGRSPVEELRELNRAQSKLDAKSNEVRLGSIGINIPAPGASAPRGPLRNIVAFKGSR